MGAVRAVTGAQDTGGAGGGSGGGRGVRKTAVRKPQDHNEGTTDGWSRESVTKPGEAIKLTASPAEFKADACDRKFADGQEG